MKTTQRFCFITAELVFLGFKAHNDLAKTNIFAGVKDFLGFYK